MSEDRTEKPTPRRLEKARKDGQIVVSREFAAAAQFAVFYYLAVSGLPAFWESLQRFIRFALRNAFQEDELIRISSHTLFQHFPVWIFGPFLGALLLLPIGSFLGQIAVAKGQLTPKRLKPNPAQAFSLKRLAEIPKQNLVNVLQGILLLALLAFTVQRIATGQGISLLSVTGAPLGTLLHITASIYKELLWSFLLLFVLIGVIDWARQQHKWSKQLKMTKQEIKDEAKESDGNPQIKGRLRKMQREMGRRRMMGDVPKASAVIVNPTHYAVAIQYQLGGSGAPKVVAKGKNYLARRIREIANAHEIPIVENPPLARSLYGSVEVGQEIPPHLYRAVAEILAYLYRLLGDRMKFA